MTEERISELIPYLTQIPYDSKVDKQTEQLRDCVRTLKGMYKIKPDCRISGCLSRIGIPSKDIMGE